MERIGEGLNTSLVEQIGPQPHHFLPGGAGVC